MITFNKVSQLFILIRKPSIITIFDTSNYTTCSIFSSIVVQPSIFKGSQRITVKVLYYIKNRSSIASAQYLCGLSTFYTTYTTCFQILYIYYNNTITYIMYIYIFFLILD